MHAQTCSSYIGNYADYCIKYAWYFVFSHEQCIKDITKYKHQTLNPSKIKASKCFERSVVFLLAFSCVFSVCPLHQNAPSFDQWWGILKELEPFPDKLDQSEPSQISDHRVHVSWFDRSNSNCQEEVLQNFRNTLSKVKRTVSNLSSRLERTVQNL